MQNTGTTRHHYWTNALLTGLLVAISGCVAPPPSAPSVSLPSETSSDGSVSGTPQNASATSQLSSADAYQMTSVIDGLDHPWGMAWLPDGSMLITERSGQLWRLQDDSELIPITGLPEILVRGQGGLLDIQAHPQFEQNAWIYFSYSSGTPQSNHTRVMRAELRDNQLQNSEIVFQVSQQKPDLQHFGSRLVWLPDQTLLISIGDGGNPPVRLDGSLIRVQAQNLESHLGKIIRINDDGSIPPDNPFASVANSDAAADPFVWSYGHRNIQGLAYDPVTDTVWASEHGARGGDELNRVEPGKNYGWPLVTHSREYAGGEISPNQSLPGMVDPLVVWTPAVAPSGVMVYRGDRFPQWQGHVFAGGLVSRAIQRFETDESGAITDQHIIPVEQRVRDVQQGPDGLIYILTDEDNGQLLRLEPS